MLAQKSVATEGSVRGAWWVRECGVVENGPLHLALRVCGVFAFVAARVRCGATFRGVFWFGLVGS